MISLREFLEGLRERGLDKADGGTKEGDKAPIRKGLFANAHEMKDRVVLALKAGLNARNADASGSSGAV